MTPSLGGAQTLPPIPTVEQPKAQPGEHDTEHDQDRLPPPPKRPIARVEGARTVVGRPGPRVGGPDKKRPEPPPVVQRDGRRSAPRVDEVRAVPYQDIV